MHSLENCKVNNTVTCDKFIAKKPEDNTNLNFIRKGSFNRLVLAHININSIRSKFDILEQQITNNVDILMIPETKLDNIFSEGQFLISGYSSAYPFDRNCRGGGIMLYVREDIPSKLLSIENQPIEGFYIEINLRKKKWLLCATYNPYRNNIGNHLDSLCKNLALYSSAYDNYTVIGDFNIEADSKEMSSFCDTFHLISFIKERTRYKNLDNPSCIDLILTNKPLSFQNSCVVETGLSDFHRMMLTVTKMTFQKRKPRVINYRDYKHFNNEMFRDDLLSEILNSYLEFDNSFDEFLNVCRSTLVQHAPRKQKYARGNHMPFMNKTLSKEIMKRTKLRNKFLKERTDESKKRYTSQRNYCVSLLKETKKNCYNGLNEKDVSDNKTFWKTVKPFLSDKIVSKEQILLVENDEIISEDRKIAESPKSFFSNIVKNLKIPGYRPHDNSLSENVSDPILKVILKYRNHPSILTIGEVCKNKSNKQPSFSFSQASRDKILKEILSLDTTKACQDTDIPTKILKENADIFSLQTFARIL